MNLLPFAIGALLVYECAWTVSEKKERNEAYRSARSYCNQVRKPLLNIGCPSTRPFGYPCGDWCLDDAPGRLKYCRSPHPILGDVCNLAGFPYRSFGAVSCFHVLEHLPTIADAQKAMAEMTRVADQVFVCTPGRGHPIAWLHPDHHLWVEPVGGGIYRIEQRFRGSQSDIIYPILKEVWAGYEAGLQAITTGDSFASAYAGARRLLEAR
jgi:hypothetical protein